MKSRTKTNNNKKPSNIKEFQNLQTILLVVLILVLILIFIYVIPDNNNEGFKSILLGQQIKDISNQKDNSDEIPEFTIKDNPLNFTINKEFTKKFSYDLEFEYMDNYNKMKEGDILKIMSLDNTQPNKYLYGILKEKKQKNCINILTFNEVKFKTNENLDVKIIGNKKDTFIYKISNIEDIIQPGCYMKLNNCKNPNTNKIINHKDWVIDSWTNNPNKYIDKNKNPLTYPGIDRETCLGKSNYGKQEWCGNPKNNLKIPDLIEDLNQSKSEFSKDGRQVTIESKFVPGGEQLNPNINLDGNHKVIRVKKFVHHSISGFTNDDYNLLNQNDSLKFIDILDDKEPIFGTINSKLLTSQNKFSIHLNADNTKLKSLENKNKIRKLNNQDLIVVIHKVSTDNLINSYINRQSDLITDKAVIDTKLNNVNTRLLSILKRFNKL